MFANAIRSTHSPAAMLLVVAVLLAAAVGPVAAQQIDDENERGMVIDDMFYRFAPDVEFYADPEKTILANRGDFRKGSKVGYELNEDGQISAVWLR